ncbi:MAG: DAK2 domain-containing protein [Acidimicrobiia bacterium]|nr:DAK2 domain-containing protein [Acidimicrobiia bacterium]MYF84362.1 DAK2 domain-containing protein [Acidimicrobiia bacterium]
MIDRDLAVRLVVAAHARVNDHQEELSRLDSVAGDGDHGVNMATALAEAARRAEHDDHGTAAGVMRSTGAAFHETVGGAAGALFGAFFGAMAGQLSKAEAPDATQLVAGMEKGLARVARVGKAEPGHKTMIDALAPAVRAACESLNGENGLEAVMAAAARAARRGATETAGMRPSAGRARFAPDHSLGTEDPGANTVALVLESWADQLRTEVRA